MEEIRKTELELTQELFDQIMIELGFIKMSDYHYQSPVMGDLSIRKCDLFDVAKGIYHLGKEKKANQIADVLGFKRID